MKTTRIKTDVLVVGAGIAGLMAAISGRERGSKVVVVEKGNSLTSGAGGCGNDHFVCYIPELHGPDVRLFIRELSRGQMGPMCQMLGPSMTETWINRTFDIAKLWDSWGIPMRHNGEWLYSGHGFPEHPRFFLKYRGKYQKKVLTEQAKKRGVSIINRAMVIELLGGREVVTGALAINTREDELMEIQAKSVFLATGQASRLYPGISPGMMNNSTLPLNLTGDGRAMTYRLGGELFNAGMLGYHVGLKNFARAGQGSWLGVYRGPDGKPLGRYVSRPDKDYGDILPEVDKKLFARIMESGRGPVYMDCRGISEEDLKFMLEGLVNEGNEVVVNHLEQEGIDLRKHAVEFMTYPLKGGAGQIRCNDKSETSVKGLYAAGDEFTYGISAAATFGWLGGENAAIHAQKCSSPDLEDMMDSVDEKKSLINSIENRRRGHDWMDANIALQDLLRDYSGSVRSGNMLEAGLNHLRRLRGKVDDSLMAENRWELTRCFEVLNLYDLAELIFHSALERKESRGEHYRVDYPYTDPLLNGKIQVIRRADGRPRIDWN